MTPALKLGLTLGLLFAVILSSALAIGEFLYQHLAPGVAAIEARSAYTGHNGTIYTPGTLYYSHNSHSTPYYRHNSIGNMAYQTRDFLAAIHEYGAMIHEKPAKPDGYLLRAMAENGAQFYTSAIKDDTTVLTLPRSPADMFYPLEPGWGRHAAFIPAMTSSSDEVIADAYFNRAQAYEGKGNYALAMPDFTACLKIAPGFDECRDARAAAYYAHKQYAEAIADTSFVIKHDLNDRDASSIRGEAEKAQGKYDAAFQDLARAVRLNPYALIPLFMLSNIAETTHQYPKTIAIEQRAIYYNPGNPLLKATLGWLQYENGEIPAAIAMDKQSLAQDPSQNWVRYNLGLCYAVAGDAANARQTYSQALAHADQSSRAGSLKDIRDALRRQPGSAALQQSLKQFTGQRGLAPLVTGAN